MAKIEYRKLTSRQRKMVEKELQSTFLNVPRKRQIVTLLLDVLTQSEHVMIARRLQTAKLLLRGMTHIKIRKRLGVSFDLIQDVDGWLDDKFKAYRKIIPPLLAEEKRQKKKKGKKDIGAPFTFKRLRKTYPDKFLLLNLLLDD